MTLNEIVEMVDAYSFAEQRRDDIENQRTSWLASTLMTIIAQTNGVKKSWKPDDLYKPLDHSKKESQEGKRFETKEEKEKYMEDLLRKFDK